MPMVFIHSFILNLVIPCESGVYLRNTGHEVRIHCGLDPSPLKETQSKYYYIYLFQFKHRSKHMQIIVNMFIVLIITSKVIFKFFTFIYFYM